MSLTLLDNILAGGQEHLSLSKDSISRSSNAPEEQRTDLVKGTEDDLKARAAVAKLFDLKKSILSCDEVLSRIQSYMGTFQADLKSVSSDIESLQTRSGEMASRLQHRKDLEAVLGPAIEESILSPQLIRRIIEAKVDRSWLAALDSLEQFSENEARQRTIKTEFPAQEVEKLRNIAVARIRDYLVTKIKSLRLPKSNIQIIQQSSLLRVRKLFTFLSRYHEVLSSEIMQAYCLTMKWYYTTHFEKYQRSLSRIQIRNITKQELLGAEEIPRSLGNMFISTQKQSVKKDSPGSLVMTLGTRAKYLHDNTSGIILAYLADTEKESYFLERVFRSYIVALVENAAVEYLFMNEFFAPKGARTISEHYSTTFEPLFQAAQNYVKLMVSDSLDVLGILTCIRVCQKLSFDLQKRKVAGLEGFLDVLLITLWPKLQSVMDLHCQATKSAAVSVSSVNESAKNKTALPFTKKFSDLVFGILVLSKASREEEPVSHSLDRLIHDFESSLTRMAATCDPKLRNQFLFRNYLHISEQIDNTAGPLAEKHKRSFKSFVESLG
ncbi:protein of unknown function [Taphrina deformans PYCC 5710]|uniref:Vacuolar protein sorting-associated protein 52 n=1 Tax=Taphrina deformans (strain PYCC 5710 / ATCC 11124 / CBS 356.35 / IMI 108563 / JCM 9778 / NBRC 8474) TaxID=1097556 RepID=R4XGC5_TAPDE|nr:protein of unknown function [Taphrina deformans PYCC 5710]|eukprot:CCG84952.1 protein of unknown function [Taphrina deformans PYCC 5710]